MARNPKTAPIAAEEAPELPPWFNAETHLMTPAGIVEKEGHVLLDEEGLPRSQALRVYRQHLAAQAATAPATDAAAGEPQE